MYDNNLSAKAQPRVPAGGAYSAPPTLAGGEGSYCPLPGTSPPPSWPLGPVAAVLGASLSHNFCYPSFVFLLKNMQKRGALSQIVVCVDACRSRDGKRCCLVCASSTRWFRSDASSDRSAGTFHTSSTNPISVSAYDRCRYVTCDEDT